MIRLFIALEIPLDIRRQIIALRDEIAGNLYARWEPIEKIHLTMKFLGDVDEKKVEQIHSRLQFITGVQAFNTGLTTFGFFRKGNMPSILWLGIETTPQLISLYNEIENRMHFLGFAKEQRSFHPHLTLLRIKPEDDLEPLKAFERQHQLDMPFQAKKLALIKSTLQHRGSVYNTLHEYNLSDNENPEGF